MQQRAYMPQAKSTEHETPPDLFDSLDAEFGPFTLDPAALPGQYTAEQIIARGGQAYCPPGTTVPAGSAWRHDGLMLYDGLTRAWSGRVFLNPPYGRQMPTWIEKAVGEIETSNCELIVALIPSRTDTKMWQRFILREAAFDRIAAPDSLQLVRFLPGRLKFVGETNSAPFPSAVVVWAR